MLHKRCKEEKEKNSPWTVLVKDGARSTVASRTCIPICLGLITLYKIVCILGWCNGRMDTLDVGESVTGIAVKDFSRSTTPPSLS